MHILFLLNSGNQMMIEEVVEISIRVSDGLTIGTGKDGTTIIITPSGLPALSSSFNWAEYLSRLLREQK